MSFRTLSAAFLLTAALLAPGAARAEDPFLGIIKEIKCVGCKPGWVTLVVNDPIESMDFELYLKDVDYNKIITPLPGKKIHDKDGQCFYWMEKPKPKPGEVKPGAAGPKGEARKPMPHGAMPVKDGSAKEGPGEAAKGSDSESAVPPPSQEIQGNPSSCIRFYRQPN
jgi:hypothetical protein